MGVMTQQRRVLMEEYGWPERLWDVETMGDENVMTVLLNEEGETTGDLNRGVNVVWT